jgi:hypothetical protein
MVPNYMENCCHTKHIYIVKGSLGKFNSQIVLRGEAYLGRAQS